jgi:diguanylate cyclase (GGDEF)-like protein/PAS domain S-box-containing protein
MKDNASNSCKQGVIISTCEPSSEADRCIVPGTPALNNRAKTKAPGAAKSLHRKPRLQHGESDSNELAAKVFEFSREGILISDNQLNILNVNRAFTEITGYAAEEVLGKKSSFAYSCREDVASSSRMLAKIYVDGCWQGEIWGRRKNGDAFQEWLTVSTATDETGRITHFIHMFSDITEKKREQSRFEYLAYHDSLTGLPNRILFNERLSTAIALAQRHNHPLGLLFLDLDGFKPINDTLGHGVGDMLLQQVAHRLSRCVRESDAVARIGGDEFAILLNELSRDHSAENVTRKILRHMHLPFTLSDNKIWIGVSIGIALFPDHGVDGITLLEKADSAMYQAKIKRSKNSRCRANFQVFSSPS